MFDNYIATITELLLVKSDATIQIYSNYFNFFNAAYTYTLTINDVDYIITFADLILNTDGNGNYYYSIAIEDNAFYNIKLVQDEGAIIRTQEKCVLNDINLCELLVEEQKLFIYYLAIINTCNQGCDCTKKAKLYTEIETFLNKECLTC